ncbi:ATP-binding cassette domain-containing protein [Brachybacterium sp. AOP43-C2-M15]|uniref:ATP-binding cassette domain-containing protein n=1 Tax=Brachybacterium sp. AOP43-C2-M15 TaxID=3457661 RepID=UPI004034D543
MRRISLRTDLADQAGLLRFLAASSPWRASALVLVIVGETAAAGGTLLGLGQVVGGLADVVQEGRATTRLVHGIVLLGASLLATPVLGAISSVLTAQLDARVRRQRSAHLAGILMRPAGIGHLDDSSTTSRATRLIENSRSWQILGAPQNAVAVVAARLTGIAPLVIVAAWNPLAALLLLGLALVVSRVWMLYLGHLLDTISGSDLSEESRRTRYAFQVAAGESTAREVRLFGILPWLRPRLGGHRRGSPLFTADVPLTREADVVALVSAVGLVGAVLFAVRQALAGELDVGHLATIIAASAAVVDRFGPIGDPQSLLLKAARTHHDTEQLLAELGGEDTSAPGAAGDPRSSSPDVDSTAVTSTGLASTGLAITGLTFGYPQQERAVLENLDLVIPAGQTVGVVGANGAGKSTLMSLIAGLETPEAGTVRLGGEPVRPAAEGRPQVAMILQDFTRLPLDVQDNVMMGRDADPARVGELLHRSGGGEILSRLDSQHSGLATPLSPGRTGGTDLSGGQWQRLALARALAAVDDGAQMLILDEPTSALDVRAEAALFQDLMALTGGVTTLLVSHRLSSVRRADRIVVLEDGGIVEDGTHEQLMAHGGRYAEMFTLQARRFAQAGGRDA